MITPEQAEACTQLAVDLDSTADVFDADGSSWAAEAARTLHDQAFGVRLALHHLTRPVVTR